MDFQWVANRFQIAQAIGKGNMGEVYRAEDTQAAEGSPDRTVAVKLILRTRSGASPNSQDDSTVQRFLREIRIMHKLHHPGLTTIVDGGIDEAGLPYLAMEYLDGATLRDLVGEHPQLPLSWVTALGAQIADALFAAHQAGVVHRDLKPANVMVVRGGLVKVLDFGMGRIVDDVDTARLTSTGVTVGTARYMAPEQFHGSAVTAAADLYALGCVLYELTTGTAPFTSGSAFEVSQKHLHEPVPDIGFSRSGVPEPLVRLIKQLLDKDPVMRP